MATVDQPPSYSADRKPQEYGTTANQVDNSAANPQQGSYEQQSYPQNGMQAESGETATFHFSDKRVRQAFIGKVFLIVMVQLFVTTAVSAIFFAFKDSIQPFLAHHLWLYILAYIVFVVTYICLVCCKSCARRTPTNYIVLAIFTLSLSFLVAAITAFHKIESVMLAFALTACLCLALTIFAWQTKIDFTMCTGLLFCLIVVFLLTGMTCWIWGLIAGPNRIIMVIYGGVGTLLFSFFLVYDVQVVVGGHSYELSPEEYVYGAVQIYMDVIQIFLMILRIRGGG